MFRYVCSTLAVVGLLMTAAIAVSAAESSPGVIDLSAGNLRLYFSPWFGLQLKARGVPVIRESHLYLVKPGWKGNLLDQDNLTAKTSALEEGGKKVGLAAFDTVDAFANYRFELTDDDTLRIVLTYGSKGQPIESEYNAAFINANILQGAIFTAETNDGPRQGVVPLYAASEDQEKSRLAPDLSKIVFKTVLGELEIQNESPDKEVSALRMFDARRNKADWGMRNPIFWLGTGTSHIPDAPRTQTIITTFRFRLKPLAEAGKVLAALPATVAAARARIPFVPEFPLVPHPKQADYAGSPARLTREARIILGAHPGPEEARAAVELQNELRNFWHLNIPILHAPVARKKGHGVEITLGRVGFALPNSKARLSLPSHAEGYVLKVASESVVVAGKDGRGVYNGVQTLKQLLRIDDKGVYLKAAAVRDWPSLAVRGVHWFGGPASWPFHQRMIDRIIAPYKMNMMLYEAEFTQWDSQPKLWMKDLSTPKADVKKTVDFARRHFIEPIPMIETLGHCDWLFNNGQNRDIAADPQRPRSYDPNNSKVYEILFPIFQEAIELFHPKTLHIGHDEVIPFSNFPPAGSKQSVTELIVQDTKRLHSWLAQHGLRTMMWGDQLQHYPEDTNDAGWAESVEGARQARAELPKDIVIADWHYQGGDPHFPSVELLQKSGYQVIGTSWFDWNNIYNFSRLLTERKAAGLLQSTWAGFANSLPQVDADYSQFVAYLVAAEYSWNGGAVPIDALGYNPDDAFRQAWHRQAVDQTVHSGMLVNLSKLSNASPWEWLPELTVKMPVESGRNAFPQGRHNWGGTEYLVCRPVWLAGSLDASEGHPAQITLDLGGKSFSELHFLWGTTHVAAKGVPVARLQITYKNGKMEETPLRYSSQIFAFEDLRGGLETVTAWSGKTPLGRPAALRRWAWKNPAPSQPIQTITLISEQSEAAPVLFGLTGIK